jgi:hypothetical protein
MQTSARSDIATARFGAATRERSALKPASSTTPGTTDEGPLEELDIPVT